MSKYFAEALDAIQEMLWSQWAGLGVPAAVKPSQTIIDPEALLYVTAAFTDAHAEDRLRDGAISWSIRHHAYVSTPRLTAMGNIVPPEWMGAFTRLAGEIGGNVKRLRWSGADTPRPWNPSTAVNLPPLDSHPALLRLRTRAMFGATARAEALAYLACSSGSVELPVIERETLYSRKQIADGLKGLQDASWIIQTRTGSRLAYQLTPAARQQLRLPVRDLQIGQGEWDRIRVVDATWVNWVERYRLLGPITAAASALDQKDTVTALAALRREEERFRAHSLSVPDALARDEDSESAYQRIGEFLGASINRIAGMGLLP